MASFNKVLLMGNLTKDPELRYTPQGTAVVNLRLAVNRKFRDRVSQEMREEVCFITVVVWDKQAETCNQYLHKGSPVFIEGRLQSRSWDDATSGQKRSVIEVRAERVQFMSSGAGRQGGGSSTPSTQETPPTTEDAWLGEESEGKIDEA
ncbi:MAG TPA: single-stranded DNA-binding protein [Candidatus Omnitrophota bacterium]|nr:single-stranded DNA-binding protein [Candidatus Omnitrophota bacterium]HPT07209.1 single-stranded DNA-binding protein [Candidatus Omnitrophota bacterium]